MYVNFNVYVKVAGMQGKERETRAEPLRSSSDLGVRQPVGRGDREAAPGCYH